MKYNEVLLIMNTSYPSLSALYAAPYLSTQEDPLSAMERKAFATFATANKQAFMDLLSEGLVIGKTPMHHQSKVPWAALAFAHGSFAGLSMFFDVLPKRKDLLCSFSTLLESQFKQTHEEFLGPESVKNIHLLCAITDAKALDWQMFFAKTGISDQDKTKNFYLPHKIETHLSDTTSMPFIFKASIALTEWIQQSEKNLIDFCSFTVEPTALEPHSQITRTMRTGNNEINIAQHLWFKTLYRMAQYHDTRFHNLVLHLFDTTLNHPEHTDENSSARKLSHQTAQLLLTELITSQTHSSNAGQSLELPLLFSLASRLDKATGGRKSNPNDNVDTLISKVISSAQSTLKTYVGKYQQNLNNTSSPAQSTEHKDARNPQFTPDEVSERAHATCKNAKDAFDLAHQHTLKFAPAQSLESIYADCIKLVASTIPQDLIFRGIAPTEEACQKHYEQIFAFAKNFDPLMLKLVKKPNSWTQAAVAIDYRSSEEFINNSSSMKNRHIVSDAELSACVLRTVENSSYLNLLSKLGYPTTNLTMTRAPVKNDASMRILEPFVDAFVSMSAAQSFSVKQSNPLHTIASQIAKFREVSTTSSPNPKFQAYIQNLLERYVQTRGGNTTFEQLQKALGDPTLPLPSVPTKSSRPVHPFTFLFSAFPTPNMAQLLIEKNRIAATEAFSVYLGNKSIDPKQSTWLTAQLQKAQLLWIMDQAPAANESAQPTGPKFRI